MSYTPPTVDDFNARFPIFADADPQLVETLLAEASGQVDDTWLESDYKPAILYLTAHLLATDNSGEGDDVAIGTANENNISADSFGGLSVSYGNVNTSAGSLYASDRYGSTEYGRRFLALLQNNFPAILVV